MEFLSTNITSRNCPFPSSVDAPGAPSRIPRYASSATFTLGAEYSVRFSSVSRSVGEPLRHAAVPIANKVATTRLPHWREGYFIASLPRSMGFGIWVCSVYKFRKGQAMTRWIGTHIPARRFLHGHLLASLPTTPVAGSQGITCTVGIERSGFLKLK